MFFFITNVSGNYRFYNFQSKAKYIFAPFIYIVYTIIKTIFQEKKMKKKIVCSVMICSLLLAVCCCSDDELLQQEPLVENYDADETETQKPNEPAPAADPADTAPVTVPTNTAPVVPVDTTPVTVSGDAAPAVPVDDTPVTVPTNTAPADAQSRIPEILINELRSETNSTSNKYEFIEFKVKTAGNLKGIKLYIMWNSKDPYIFELPPVDVNSGEYITYHLRTLENDSVNELGENLSLSGGTDSNPEARDLWVAGDEKWLHRTDIVYLQDANGSILDAVIINESPFATWSKERQHFAEISLFLFNHGAWKPTSGQSPSPMDAVDTSKIGSGVTRSVSRHEDREDTNTNSDWYVTEQKGVTPGYRNKPNAM
jgi:hypothetical protein